MELTSVIPDLAISESENGVGLVVRRRGAPVALILRAVREGTTLAADDVDRMIGREAGVAIIRRALRDDFVPATPSTVPITVAVCTRDRTARLQRCLASIAVARSNDSGGAVEVVVVDNAPPDDATRALVSGMCDVRYLAEPLPGLDFARNRALHAATGEILAYVDDDVVVDPQWLVGLRAAWGEHPDAGCVTGLVLPLDLSADAQVRFEQRGGFGRGFDQIRWEGMTDPANPLHPFGAGVFGAGCNMAFRRRLVIDLGGFDEALDTGPPLPGGGDIDMFFRVARAGEPLVYDPRAAVAHEHRREYEALKEQYRSWGTGFMAFLAKWYPQVEPAERARMRRLVRWWFGYEARLLVNGAIGRRGMTIDLAVAELRGGLIGLAGEYGRSRRRVDRIRQEAPR